MAITVGHKQAYSKAMRQRCLIHRARNVLDARISEMAARYRPAYPSAMKCLTSDAEGLTAYLRFPAEHHNQPGGNR